MEFLRDARPLCQSFLEPNIDLPRETPQTVEVGLPQQPYHESRHRKPKLPGCPKGRQDGNCDSVAISRPVAVAGSGLNLKGVATGRQSRITHLVLPTPCLAPLAFHVTQAVSIMQIFAAGERQSCE